MRKGVNNEETKLPPSRKWKKKYDCKVNKGAHTLVLVKPDMVGNLHESKKLSAEEYYKKEDAQMKKRCKDNPSDWPCCHLFTKMRHYKCSACGFKITTIGEIS